MDAPTTLVSGRIRLLLRQAGAGVLHSFAAAGGVPADQWPRPRCAVGARGHVIADDGRRRRLVMTFAYDPADPWVARIDARPLASRTGWLVSRDRLAAALRRGADGGPLIVPVLTRPGEPPWDLVLLLPGRGRLSDFLGRSYDLVPDGAEGRALASWIDQFAHYLAGG